MSKVQTRHQVFKVGDVIRHRRRRHVRRKIVSFEQGLPWTFRLDAQDGLGQGNSMLITRIEEWELADGETEKDSKATLCQDDSPLRMD